MRPARIGVSFSSPEVQSWASQWFDDVQGEEYTDQAIWIDRRVPCLRPRVLPTRSAGPSGCTSPA
eukprot:438906-Pyramimonas_sp.AAC.1